MDKEDEIFRSIRYLMRANLQIIREVAKKRNINIEGEGSKNSP